MTTLPCPPYKQRTGMSYREETSSVSRMRKRTGRRQAAASSWVHGLRTHFPSQALALKNARSRRCGPRDSKPRRLMGLSGQGPPARSCPLHHRSALMGVRRLQALPYRRDPMRCKNTSSLTGAYKNNCDPARPLSLVICRIAPLSVNAVYMSQTNYM